MKIEVLLSTMNKNNHYDVRNNNITSNCLVVNQTNYNNEIIKEGEKVIKIIANQERGISRSRNRAIEKATGDILLFADDDIKYVDDYENIIQFYYEKYKEADIIIFDIKSDNKTRQIKKISKKPLILKYFRVLKVCSCGITFRRESITKNRIKMNKYFGAGSLFTSGEESIFLYECLRKKLKIYYFPIIIAVVEQKESSWFNGFNKKYFMSKGALAYELYKKYYFIYILQFAIRKYKLYRENYAFFSAIKTMIRGKVSYKKIIEQNERS